MKKQLFIQIFIKLSLAFLIIQFVSHSVYGYTKIDKVKENGKKNIRILERIYKKYPISIKQKSEFEKVKTVWEKNLKDLNLINKKNRREAEKNLIEVYKEIKTTLEKTCEILAVYGNDLIINFQKRLDEEKPNSIDKEKYVNQFNVSRREFMRAEKAFRSEYYYYSAHLYDRGIQILVKIHERLNWTIPPAYRNLIN